MDRARAKELAPIIQAFADGKTVQCLSADVEWYDVKELGAFNNATYRIKPEPKTRPMTRGEVLYMVTTTPAMVVRYYGSDAFPSGHSDYDGSINRYEYAIIDKHGDPVDGWHKFEVEE